MDKSDRTAELMTPTKLAQVNPKGSASPVAWLNQMAADAGHQHVARLAQLSEQLQAQALRLELPAVVDELKRLGEALPRVDFGPLQSQGWWARITGKSRAAGGEFARRCAPVLEVAKDTAALALQKSPPGMASDRDLLEVEVEFRSLEKIIEQGTRWLHDMRKQLKAREAAGPDEPGRRQIADDTARCEILVSRLDALRAVVGAAQLVHEETLAAQPRRVALFKMLQDVGAADMKTWRERMSTLVQAAGAGATSGSRLEDAMETHRELQLCIKQAIADCNHLQEQERALADSLAALDARLQAAR